MPSMLLGALTPTAGLPPFLAAALPPASSMVMAVPPLPQPNSPGTQHSTLLLTEDPSLLTSCVLLKPPRLTSGPFLPPHNLPEPSLQYSFCESLPWVVSVCVCVHACTCVHELLPQLHHKPSEDKDPIQFTLVLSPELPLQSRHLLGAGCWLRVT